MVLSAPDVTVSDDIARARVTVELDTAFPLLPDTFPLWYEVPAEHKEALPTEQGDAFLVGLLFLAMRLHEDVKVRAPTSPRLMRGLREYQRIFEAQFDYLKAVDLQHEGHARPARTGTGTGTFFSGGVDSFFTLWSHLEGREPIPDYQITHGLFIDGFDTKRPGTSTFQTAFSAYKSLFDDLGCTLIPVRTNLKTYINNETVGWRAAHGAFLMSIALLVQSALDVCYVPSTEQYGDDANFKYGSNPLVDHLLSTDRLELIHDGAWASRPEKTATIAEWPATHDHLYVCFDRKNASLENCCRCEKCIRTMIALKIEGRLDQYSTFPLPLEHRHIRGWELPYFNVSGGFADELLAHAAENERTTIANDLRYVLWTHRLRHSTIGRLLRRHVVKPAKRSDWISSLYYRLVA